MGGDLCLQLRRNALGIVTMPKNPNSYATDAYSLGLRRNAQRIVTRQKNPNSYATGAYSNGVDYHGLSGLYLRTREAIRST